MTPDEHRRRHKKLHKALDELFADFITCHPEEHAFSQKPIMELLQWSHLQTINPQEPKQCQ